MLEKFAAQSLVEHDGELIFSKERFAELIVEECINVCKSRVGNSDYNTGRLHCVSDIRERFEFGMTTEDKKNLIKELLRVNK
jgi:uncharacterized membrane protein